MTVLMALSSIAVEQTKATEKTLGRCVQLLNYLASNSEAKVRYLASNLEAKVRYHASDMIINIFTRTCRTFRKQKRAAEHAGIFSWDGCQRMGSRSN